MGMFDTFYAENGNDHQIKTYSRTLKAYRLGDTVENDNLPSNHTVLTSTGKCINVVDNVIVSFTEYPESDNISDKWLRVIPSKDNCGDWYERMKAVKCDYWGKA